jgi:hypothetical protein
MAEEVSSQLFDMHFLFLPYGVHIHQSEHPAFNTTNNIIVKISNYKVPHYVIYYISVYFISRLPVKCKTPSLAPTAHNEYHSNCTQHGRLHQDQLQGTVCYWCRPTSTLALTQNTLHQTWLPQRLISFMYTSIYAFNFNYYSPSLL